VVIPSKMRKSMKLKKGDFLAVVQHADLLLLKKVSVDDKAMKKKAEQVDVSEFEKKPKAGKAVKKKGATDKKASPKPKAEEKPDIMPKETEVDIDRLISNLTKE